MSDIPGMEKRLEDDRCAVIEDDVWVGTRAIILHWVGIGRGVIARAAEEAQL